MGWRTNQVPRAGVLIRKLTVPKLVEAVTSNTPKAISDLRSEEGSHFSMRQRLP